MTQSPNPIPNSDPSESPNPPSPDPEREQPSTDGGWDWDPQDFEAIGAADFDDGLGVEGGGASFMPGGEPGVLTKDEFWQGVFLPIFNAPSFALQLQSLHVPEDDRNGRMASDALYETALEVHWLRFLVEPGNVWFRRITAMGLFFGGKLMMLQAELTARRKAKQSASDAAAGDDAPPRGEGADGLEGLRAWGSA